MYAGSLECEFLGRSAKDFHRYYTSEPKIITQYAVFKSHAHAVRHFYAKESAQIVCAQPHAYTPSSSFASVDSPPLPATVTMVFLSASYW